MILPKKCFCEKMCHICHKPHNKLIHNKLTTGRYMPLFRKMQSKCQPKKYKGAGTPSSPLPVWSLPYPPIDSHSCIKMSYNKFLNKINGDLNIYAQNSA